MIFVSKKIALNSKPHTYLLFGIAVIFTGIMVFWLGYDPAKAFTVSEPGMDGDRSESTSALEKVKIGAIFNKYTTTNTTLIGKWPRFRGPDADNIVKDEIPLLSSFGEQGPQILWEITLGEGHAAPAIFNGKAYVMDYLESKKQDALRCFALETGEELWRRAYDVHIKRNHGMSRTIPAVNKEFVVTIGPMGHVMCVHPETGDLLWTIDLVADFGTEIPFWYTGQCPLIDENVAVLATGGKSTLIGVDCNSGSVLWETPNPDGYQMSHSSVMPMNINGVQMYVYAAIGGIVGISAREQDRGKLLWKTNSFDPNVIAPSPVYLGNGKILVTAGYGAGSVLLQISSNMEVTVLDRYKPKDGLASEQQTPIVLGENVYGILPKDAGQYRNQFVCYDINDLRNPLWSSGKEDRYGLGPYIFADNKCYILADDGTMTIAKVNRNGFVILDKQKIMEGNDAWGPIAIADGMMLIRDSKKMLCLNIKA